MSMSERESGVTGEPCLLRGTLGQRDDIVLAQRVSGLFQRHQACTLLVARTLVTSPAAKHR
jgi:hypothetical protein